MLSGAPRALLGGSEHYRIHWCEEPPSERASKARRRVAKRQAMASSRRARPLPQPKDRAWQDRIDCLSAVIQLVGFGQHFTPEDISGWVTERRRITYRRSSNEAWWLIPEASAVVIAAMEQEAYETRLRLWHADRRDEEARPEWLPMLILRGIRSWTPLVTDGTWLTDASAWATVAPHKIEIGSVVRRSSEDTPRSVTSAERSEDAPRWMGYPDNCWVIGGALLLTGEMAEPMVVPNNMRLQTASAGDKTFLFEREAHQLRASVSRPSEMPECGLSERSAWFPNRCLMPCGTCGHYRCQGHGSVPEPASHWCRWCLSGEEGPTRKARKRAGIVFSCSEP